MDVRELQEHRDQYQILDVREPYECEVGIIEGSVMIPLNDVLAGAERGRLDLGRPIAVVCKVGNRSELAAVMLRARGYDAQNLEGGLEAWQAEGNAISTMDGGPGQVL
ncbi:MAG TPA: rhodanese-like domain-containing protein [Actinomycetota bacterium]|nr:rhodanese-like domain-containing protein [Actinomycetota bacterium]